MVASEGEVCPVCVVRGESGTLKLFQINLGQAIKVCSHPKCTYPLGLPSVPVIARNASDVVKKKRKGGHKKPTSVSSKSSTCSGSSRSSTPSDHLNTNWSPGLLTPPLRSPALLPTAGKTTCIPSPPRPTRVTTLDDTTKSTRPNTLIPTAVKPVKPPCIQWKNKEALCWLDVVMCLLVHCKQLRNLLTSNPQEQGILRTLITAYDQAQALAQLAVGEDPASGLDKTASLETSVGTIPVKTGGGVINPLTGSPLVNVPNLGLTVAKLDQTPSKIPEDDDEFFKCLDNIDLNTDSPKLDVNSLEALLEDDWVSPAKIKTPLKKGPASSHSASIPVRPSKETCLAEAALLLEDVSTC